MKQKKHKDVKDINAKWDAFLKTSGEESFYNIQKALEAALDLKHHWQDKEFKAEVVFNYIIDSVKAGGVDINYQDEYDRQIFVLFRAALWSTDHLKKFVEECSPDLTLTFHDNSTPLFYAARFGYEENLKFFLKCGMGPNISRTEGTFPLYGAAERGHLGCVSILLDDNRTNVKAVRECDGSTALHVAVKSNHLEIVKMLIDKEPDLLSIKDKGGDEPSFYAQDEMKGLLKSHFPLMKDLLGDLDSRDPDSESLLRLSI